MGFPAAVYTDNEAAGAALTNNAAAAGLSVTGLQPVAQLQSVVANLLVDAPSIVDVPAGDIVSGTFGSSVTPADTGMYSFPAQIGVGTASLGRNGIRMGATSTASSGSASGIANNPVLVAAANNDVLLVYTASPTLTPGAFTGLQVKGVSIPAFTVAAFTTPADPIGYDLGIITGTGATNAFGVRIAPPTGATNNYLIAHTTPATFNVTAAGDITTATTLTAAGQAYLGRTVKKVPIQGVTLTALGTTQNSTPTAAQLLGGAVTQTSVTGAGTVTTPTGAVLSTAITGVATGDSFSCLFSNLGGGQTLTITAGATGMTVVGTAAVGSAKNALLTFVNTGTDTWNCYVTVSA